MMVQLKTTDRKAMTTFFPVAFARVFLALLSRLRAHNAAILRLLILALLALLLAFVGLLLTTGRMEVGLPVLGGVLFIGFAASQIGRDTEVARSPADDGR